MISYWTKREGFVLNYSHPPPSQDRPAQLAELPRNKFDPELFPHSACSDYCDIRNKSAVFNILQQSVTNFDVGNGERRRKWRRREEMKTE